MAITKIEFPTTGTPITSTDYTKQNELIANLINLNGNRVLTNWENTSIPMIKQGSVISYADNLYIVDTSDYTILSAPASDGTYYVEITAVSATELQAEWVSSKSGYIWNESRNGWYNVDDMILSELITRVGTIYKNEKWVNQFLDHFSFSENSQPIFKITDDTNSSFYMQKVVTDSYGLFRNQYYNGASWINPVTGVWSGILQDALGINFYSGASGALVAGSKRLQMSATTGDFEFFSTTNSTSPTTGAITAKSIGLTGDFHAGGKVNSVGVTSSGNININKTSGENLLNLNGTGVNSRLYFQQGSSNKFNLGTINGTNNFTFFNHVRGANDIAINSATGKVDISTDLEVGGSLIAGSISAPIVTTLRTSAGSETGTVSLVDKLIEIGDWNMDATESVSFAHGITSSLIMIKAITILDDAATTQVSLSYQGTNNPNAEDGGGGEVIGANIVLKRRVGAESKFDNTNYNSTSYNRGYVLVSYLV